MDPDHKNGETRPHALRWAGLDGDQNSRFLQFNFKQKVQRKFFCYKTFSKSYEFLRIFVIFVGLTHSNLHTTHTIIARPKVSSQKLLSFSRAFIRYTIWWNMYLTFSFFDPLTAPSLGAFFSKRVPLLFNFPGWFRCSFPWRITLWYPFIYTNNNIFCSGEAIFCKFEGYFYPLFWHRDNLPY